jgi:hypothetical protein
LHRPEAINRQKALLNGQLTHFYSSILGLLYDVIATVGEGASVDHAASTNSSILKLSGCPLYAPWSDGSRWGHHKWGSKAFRYEVEIRSLSGHSETLLATFFNDLAN